MCSKCCTVACLTEKISSSNCRVCGPKDGASRESSRDCELVIGKLVFVRSGLVILISRIRQAANYYVIVCMAV